MFPTPSAEAQLQFRTAYAAPKTKGRSENPNSSLKKLREKWWDTKRGCREQALSPVAAGRSGRRQVCSDSCHTTDVLPGCCGEAPPDTLSRATWKLLSHESTGAAQGTPHTMVNIGINASGSSRALARRVRGMFLAFWDSCLSDLTVHTLLINTVNPNSSSSPP